MTLMSSLFIDIIMNIQQTKVGIEIYYVAIVKLNFPPLVAIDLSCVY